MPFHRVSAESTHLVRSFLSRAGRSLETFRYFATRPLSVVGNHLCTWVIESDGQVEAYGHLDREDGVIWLGIAVTDHARGRGYGRMMMQRLMESASALGIQTLRLSVDDRNEPAIRLYERFGFRLVERREARACYEWTAPVGREAVMSSLAFRGQSPEAMIHTAQQHGFAVEFSSGIAYRPDLEQLFLSAPVPRFAHNYFPAPPVAFVLNLGSGDREIRRTSVGHCAQGIRLSYAVGAPIFSAHAAFCVDPRPCELGRQLSRVASFDREAHRRVFAESVREVLALTADLPTGFLIENNVLATMNVYEDGSHPLLGVRAREMRQLLEEIGDPRLGVLLDTGHLKVTAATLGFDPVAEARDLLAVTRCVHHSDNDGRRDDNEPFGRDYWFLPLMENLGQVMHVLEVQPQSPEELGAMSRLLFS